MRLSQARALQEPVPAPWSLPVPLGPAVALRTGLADIKSQGRIINVDDDQRAALFNGARARVQERWYRPDMVVVVVVVELLDDGPGWPEGTWRRGTTGALPLRYFIPDQGKKSAKQLNREIAMSLAEHAERRSS